MQALSVEKTLNTIKKDHSISLNAIKGAKVLLVEDNEINREFAEEMLRSEGIIVESAHDGFEAIEKIKTERYDLILMDVQMPNLDGIEATRRIRKMQAIMGDDYYAKVPIVALSANALQSDIDISLESGMNAYIQKPVDPNKLFATMLTWIKHRNITPSVEAKEHVIKKTDHIDDFSSLKGIDFKAALARTMQNEDLLVRLLRQFHDNYSNTLENMKKLIEQNKLVEAEAECHMLKGLCGNLGANELFNKLQLIDTELKSSNLPTKEQLNQSQILFDEILNSIGEFLEHIPQKKENDYESVKKSPTKLKKALQEVVDYLDTDISIAIDRFESLQISFGNQLDKDKLKIMQEALQKFDTDAVKEQATVILKHIEEM